MAKPYLDMDLITFQRRFGTEKSCRKRLLELRWPEGYRCPRCGCHDAYYLDKRMLYQCVECKFQTSLTAGTVMHRTRTPLVKWFWAIDLVATDKRHLSALALSRKIDIGLKCAWTMLHKIRRAMEARDAGYQLLGLIRADDAFFSGGVKKGGDKRGRGTSKVPVLVMAATKDDSITFARLEVLGNVDGKHIKAVLEKRVACAQAIKTDGLAAFNVAKEIGHKHIPVVVYPKEGKPDYDVSG